MKQIGNLAVVCARRQDVLLQVGSEKVCVHYSTVANQPDASANRGNGGRGPILWWGRAAHWQFADGVCSVFDSEQKHTEEELVMSFRVLEKEAA